MNKKAVVVVVIVIVIIVLFVLAGVVARLLGHSPRRIRGELPVDARTAVVQAPVAMDSGEAVAEVVVTPVQETQIIWPPEVMYPRS